MSANCLYRSAFYMGEKFSAARSGTIPVLRGDLTAPGFERTPRRVLRPKDERYVTAASPHEMTNGTGGTPNQVPWAVENEGHDIHSRQERLPLCAL